MSARAISVRRRRKVMAIVAGGMAVGVAGFLTLAAWNDNEWVFGGTSGDGGDGVGTSSFNVQQNAWSGDTAPADLATFTDHETNPGNELIFNVNPSALTPGATIYAPVALTTTTESIAGTLTLQPAVAADGMTAVDADGLLWSALQYSVAVTEDPAIAATCTSGTLAGTEIVTDQPLTSTIAGTPSQALAAANGDVQYYCFEITLPDTEANQALQGRTVFPAWRFAAESED